MTRRKKQPTEAVIREIRRRTRRKLAPEEKIRIVRRSEIQRSFFGPISDVMSSSGWMGIGLGVARPDSLARLRSMIFEA